MESKESSVLFSLKELMTLEEQRITAEEGERSRHAEDAARALEASERQRREEEQARTRAEAWREREQAAHLQAIREAEIEKVRREAERFARPRSCAAGRSTNDFLSASIATPTRDASSAGPAP